MRSFGSGSGNGNGGGSGRLTAAANFALNDSAMSAQADKVDEAVDDAWDWLGPFVTSLGFSGLLGFAGGAAFKLVGRALAIAVGITFALLQVKESLEAFL